MKKLLLTIMLLIVLKLTFSQDNCLQRFPLVYTNYNPLIEYYLPERLNHAPNRVKSIKAFSPRLQTSLDSFERLLTINGHIDSSLLFNSEIFEYDTLGRLVEYVDIYEWGKVSYHVRKIFKHKEVIRKLCSNGVDITEVYKLNEYNLPTSMYRNGELALDYEYDNSNNIIKIIEKRTPELVCDFRFDTIANNTVITCYIDGVKSRVLTYDNTYQLQGLESYSDSKLLSQEWIFSYNGNNKNKFIQLNYNEEGSPYNNDISYLYNNDGTLDKEIEFRDISWDVLVRRYLYYKTGEIRIIYVSDLNNEGKLKGLILYTYEYF